MNKRIKQPPLLLRALYLGIASASLLALPAISAAQSTIATIHITTEYLYPLNIAHKDGGAIYGQAADKVHELFKRSQLPYQMKMMSWNRALELARKNADTCVFSTAKIKERENWFQWVGPIATGNWTIFGNPDKLGKVTKIEDLKQSSIGTEVGNVTVAYLTEKGYHIITSNESATTFKNLALGRIDYVAAGDTHGKKIIAENKLDDKVVMLFNFNSSDYYLACNKHMDATTIALLNSKLREMKVDGSFKNIDSKY